MSYLHAKRIVLGVTGGIAAYKSCELVRALRAAGAEVQVVMTEAATRFVAPLTFEALSGQPVLTSLWDGASRGMAHIDLERGADLLLVAPATADFLARLAQGRADDLLAALCLARTGPLLVAPAMNQAMWNHPATRRNLAQLVADGVVVLGPEEGPQACGESGPGRMLEPAAIAEELEAFLSPKWLAGLKVVVTAGPTLEAIDPVRVITNRSSGKMGYAVARAAREAGAEVVLVSGPTQLVPPRCVRALPVTTAGEMLARVEQEVATAQMFIAVAAVADYRVLHPADHKIKKGADSLTLELAPNPDILATIASRPDAPFCVGFAAESEDLLEFAERKRRRKNLPLIAANRVDQAVGRDETQLTLLDDTGIHPLPPGPKLAVARRLIEHAAALYHATRGVAAAHSQPRPGSA